MFTSLRFPDGKAYPEVVLSPEAADLAGILKQARLSAPQQKSVLRFLPRSCPDPNVLSYRAEFAAELLSSPTLQQIFGDFSSLGEEFPSPEISRNSTAETDMLQTITLFEAFSARFDAFRTSLEGVVPQSTAAKRFFLFCRNYGESFEYKELKIKAAEIRRAFGFKYGCSLTVGNPTDPAGTVRLRKGMSPPQGVCTAADRLLEEFGHPRITEKEKDVRPYTDEETAVLTGIIRKDQKLSRRLEEFCDLYAFSGSETLMRLRDEALFYTAVNKIYKAGYEKGYSVCRPVFRKPGFYSEIFGLNYTAQAGNIDEADFITSPLNHITVAAGPDAESYLQAVGFAHLCASAGGLIFAREAEISPINCLGYDKEERIRTDILNEESLCLCAHLFDVMLPRQEEAAVNEVILNLNDTHSRSVIRICSKSNLSTLQKKIDGGILPPCTLLEIGTDQTLEELLRRHKLTPQCLEEEA